MRKKNKTISDSVSCLEGATSSTNVVKNVKVLGIHSKNGRIYPLDVMRTAVHKYEGIVVNLDHKPNEPRSVMDRFGKLENCYMGDDGIYGDLVYNPEHPYAKAFEYFVDNQKDAVGLSHAAIARTKMDRSGQEIVEDIVELESVDLVANAATNRSLFESYTRIMESTMKKKNEEKDMDKKEEATLVEPGKKVHVPEEFMKKEFESYEAYCKGMEEAIESILSSDLDHDKKKENIMGLLAPKDMDMKAEGKEVMGLDESEDKDKDDKKDKKEEAVETKDAAESFIRQSDKLGLKLLMEELDSFRAKDAHAKLIDKIKGFCNDAGLNEKLVTEAFIDVLASVDETKWKHLVEDRKSIAASTKSISFSSDVAANYKELTVDDLVKKLRS